ncbi:MAG TPA: formaldehyde-activating enzyme [Pseudonocardia sp.]|nr:formaldehyde-activating enzyme [Pseudonocardia sp.]
MRIGESFIGDGVDAAHINTVLGVKDGPVGVAWATALATPREGHVPFVAVLQPGMPTRPLTLFVNKATIAGERHATLTWGAAQAGVAAGVADAVFAGTVPRGQVGELVLIAAVWVNPMAEYADAVYANNREATARALAAGAADGPAAAALLDEVLAARDAPANPFYRPGIAHRGLGGGA